MDTITLGKPLLHLQTVDSTNNYALRLAKQQETLEGTVILADFQTGGRGQGTNQWQSESGVSLLFSIILRPVAVPAARQFYLSMTVATGIVAGLSHMGMKAAVKWPNDILVADKKLAGILIENTVMGLNLNTSVVGVGLNVNQEGFPVYLSAATSLRLETGQKVDPDALLTRLLEGVGGRIALLYDGQYARIKSDYLNLLWKLNIRTGMKDAMGPFTGRIADVAESGELIVTDPHGKIRKYGFREVSFGE